MIKMPAGKFAKNLVKKLKSAFIKPNYELWRDDLLSPSMKIREKFGLANPFA